MHLARGLYPDLVQLEEWQLLFGSASLLSSSSVAPPSWLLRDKQLAMGQGQSEIAMTMLKYCSQSGDWLLLKNVHLVTTEPHVKFPAILLHQSVKIA
jgi:hypothetical protein